MLGLNDGVAMSRDVVWEGVVCEGLNDGAAMSRDGWEGVVCEGLNDGGGNES